MDRGEGVDTCDLIDGIVTLAPDPQAVADRAARLMRSRAMRLSQRVRTGRAKAEIELSELLPPAIDPGDSWHVISGGNIDGLSYLQHLLRAGPFDHVVLSTWCMSLEDVKQLAEWLGSSQIGVLDVYVGEIFPSQYAAAYELLCATVRSLGRRGRVAVFRNHSKIIVAASHTRREYIVVESSANLNTNPRTEQTALTHDRGLAEFYVDFFAGVRSFQRNFDDHWIRHAWPPAQADRAQAH